MKLTDGLTALRCEKSKADPFISKKLINKEAEVMVVVHVDDILWWQENELRPRRNSSRIWAQVRDQGSG